MLYLFDRPLTNSVMEQMNAEGRCGKLA